jgi:hypothetical protein
MTCISDALANGLMHPWLPRHQIKPIQMPNTQLNSTSSIKNKSPTRNQNIQNIGKGFITNPESLDELKKALEVFLAFMLIFILLF